MSAQTCRGQIYGLITGTHWGHKKQSRLSGVETSAVVRRVWGPTTSLKAWQRILWTLGFRTTTTWKYGVTQSFRTTWLKAPHLVCALLSHLFYIDVLLSPDHSEKVSFVHRQKPNPDLGTRAHVSQRALKHVKNAFQKWEPAGIGMSGAAEAALSLEHTEQNKRDCHRCRK